MKLNKVGGKAGDVVRLPGGAQGKVLWFEPAMVATHTMVQLDSGERRRVHTSDLTLVRRATGRRSGGRKEER